MSPAPPRPRQARSHDRDGERVRQEADQAPRPEVSCGESRQRSRLHPAQLSSRSPIRAVTISSLTSSPRSMIAFTFIADRRTRWRAPRAACRRSTAGPCRVSPAAERPAFPSGARRSQKDDIQHCGALSLFAEPELAPPRRGLELRLLDEVAVLVRDQVALDLAHRVHRHVDNDQ